MGFFSSNLWKYFYKFLCCLFYILLLVLSIFLIFANSNSVRAEVTQSNYDLMVSFFENSGYDSFFILNSNELILFNNIEGTKFFIAYSNWFSCTNNDNINTMLYKVENNQVVFVSNSIRFGNGSNRYWIGGNSIVGGNHDVYTNDSFTSLAFTANYVPPVVFTSPALYPNASDVQSEQDALTSGNFTFFKVNPGSLSPDDEILLNFYNTTNFDSQNNVVGSYTLNRNSPFFQWTNTEETEFQYVLTARFLDWFQIVNGQSYRAQLGFIKDGQTQYVYYNWTMSLTAEQQQTEEQKTQQEINQGLNDLNGFLQNDNFDENKILDNLPSVEINSPTDNQLDNLFDVLKNAFINNNSTDFEFTIPNSNGKKIIIPSDLISSHLPTIIVTIIQVFYWYIIARYIFKDAWGTIDKLRQGTYFDGGSSDIKTEVL